MAAKHLTHFDKSGQAAMVDVAGKDETRRVARARGRITMLPETLEQIGAGTAKKGDVLGVARIAAIQAAKHTSLLIPLCHPLALTRVTVEFALRPDGPGVECSATVETVGRTGVEMEALTAVAVAGLALHDMIKAVDPAAVLDSVRLVRKEGGKSGRWIRPEDR